MDVIQILVNGQLAGQVPLGLGTMFQLQVVRLPDPPAPPAPPPATAEPQGGSAAPPTAPEPAPKPPKETPTRRTPPKR